MIRKALLIGAALALACVPVLFAVAAFAQEASAPVADPSVLDLLLALVPAAARPWVQLAALVVAVASAIAAATPTPAQGTWRYTVYRILVDLPALNVLRAKQVGDAPSRLVSRGSALAPAIAIILASIGLAACSAVQAISSGAGTLAVVGATVSDLQLASRAACAEEPVLRELARGSEPAEGALVYLSAWCGDADAKVDPETLVWLGAVKATVKVLAGA